MITFLADVTPWWSDSVAGWIGAVGGSGCGLIFGTYGSLAGFLAPRGIGRKWMLPIHITCIVLSMLTAVGGLVALIGGQPYRVWYPLLLIGAVGVFVMLPLYFVIRTRYRQAEMRKIDAGEFRS